MAKNVMRFLIPLCLAAILAGCHETFTTIDEQQAKELERHYVNPEKFAFSTGYLPTKGDGGIWLAEGPKKNTLLVDMEDSELKFIAGIIDLGKGYHLVVIRGDKPEATGGMLSIAKISSAKIHFMRETPDANVKNIRDKYGVGTFKKDDSTLAEEGFPRFSSLPADSVLQYYKSIVSSGSAMRDGFIYAAALPSETLAVKFTADGTPVFPAKRPEELVREERFQKNGKVLTDTVLGLDVSVTTTKLVRRAEDTVRCEDILSKDLPGIYKGEVWREVSSGMASILEDDYALVESLGLDKYERAKLGVGAVIIPYQNPHYIFVESYLIAAAQPDFLWSENRTALKMCIRAHTNLDKEEYNLRFAGKVSKKYSEIYAQIKHKNTINAYKAFIDYYRRVNIPGSDFPSLDVIQDVYSSVYAIVKKQNTIAGYAWFINSHPSSPLIKDALQKMYQAGFDLAAQENTVEAYNDFLVAFPLAPQTGQASKAAYDLEKAAYEKGKYGSQEKDSRALLIQSKQFYRKAGEANDMRRSGYLMIVERMNRLLETLYPAEEATLRHLESEEFRSFSADLKTSLNSINNSLSAIQGSVADAASLLSEQTSVMNRHFVESAQSQRMSEELTRQHRNWERYGSSF